MKKCAAAFFISICLILSAGCSSAPGASGSSELISSEEPRKDAPSAREAENSAEPAGAVPDEDSVTWRLRIADGAESGFLVLAGENPGELLTLSPDKDVPVYLDGQEADLSVLEDGMTLDVVFDGMVMETFPSQIGQVHSLRAYSLGTEENPGGGFYDLCGFYLQVLNDLWDRDPGLNSNIDYISVDLSQAPGGLSEGEKQAVAWLFACQHGAEPLTFSHSELAENGYLTALHPDSSQNPLYQWENGILFTITPGGQESGQISSALNFNAEKWRSPRGAYIFSDCLAVWPETGTWSDYQVGSESIS